ncbi:MAG: hypothetical protein WA261_01905 [Candidatus Sulfotelmatobacter sp.]
MHATAGANPEAAAITEVIRGGSEKTAQTGPVGLRHGKMGGEESLAGLVEGVTAWSESHKTGKYVRVSGVPTGRVLIDCSTRR